MLNPPITELHEEIATILRMLRFSYEAIISIDQTQKIVIFNKGAEKIFGYSADEVLGKPVEMLIPERFRAEHKKHVMQFAQSKDNDFVMHHQKSIYGLRNNGEEFPVESSIYMFEHGGDVTMTAVLRDVSETVQIQDRLLQLATHDYLTKLPNRLLFDDRLATAISRAERNQQKVALLFLDMDNFKMINDRLGHHAGDELLKVIANRIQSFIRDSDTASRLGGDEFALILENIAGRGAVDETVQNLRHALEQSISLEEESVIPLFSIGVALYPEDGANIELLLKKADHAMFVDKGSKRKQQP